MIIITGASRGLGLSIANRLISLGEKVIGLSKNIGQMEFETIRCDVSSFQEMKAVSRTLKKRNETIEAVINAAGIASMNMALTTDSNTVQNLIQTNLVGTINICQTICPLMIRKKNGIIINFSTIAVPLSLKGESIYVATKAGVEAFTKCFAKEVSEFNIRVNCIAPGPIETDLIRGLSEKQLSNVISRQIIQKYFNKSDVCDLVEILLSEKMSSITGQVLNVGGV